MKVIYVVLVCLLAFTSCAETEYAENGVDKKNITGYTEVGFYSLDGICTFTEQEQSHPHCLLTTKLYLHLYELPPSPSLL